MEKITLTFTVEEANLIMASLHKMPYEAVFRLIANIQEQAQKQMNPALAPASSPPANT